MIRQLTPDDEEKIIDLIHESLKHEDDLFVGELVASEENANTLFFLEVLPCIIDDDPCFGWFEDSTLLGFSTCSTKINNMYKLKKPAACGVLTLVHYEHRRKGIGSKLRLEIGKALKQKGIKQFIFEIKKNNEASLSNANSIATKINADPNLLSYRFLANTDDLQ
jgi:predicted acetyltransferase